MNIGRQRHLTQLVEDLLKHAVVVEFHLAAAILGIVDDLGAQKAIAKGAERAGTQPAAGTHKALPHILFQTLEQQDLHRHAGILLFAQQTGRDNLGFIHHQHIALFQKLGQIIKMQVLNALVLAVVYQKAAVVARFHGGLRNQLLWQVVVKIAGLHRCSCSPSSIGTRGLRPRCS